MANQQELVAPRGLVKEAARGQCVVVSGSA